MKRFQSRPGRYILFLIVTLFVAVILKFVVPQVRLMRAKPSVEELLLSDDEACAPPCWQGITPGVTSAEEGEQLLRELP